MLKLSCRGVASLSGDPGFTDRHAHQQVADEGTRQRQAQAAQHRAAANAARAAAELPPAHHSHPVSSVQLTVRDARVHHAAQQRRHVDATIRWLARLELDDDQRAALRDLAGPARRRSRGRG